MALNFAAPPSNRGGRIPQEISDIRRSNFDFHKTLGQPVIHKHRWNEQDVRNGLAQHCPFHDETYQQDSYDEYCFGTGYLGGWGDGQVVFVTIADTVNDLVRFVAQGLVVQTQTPGLTAPWYPEMGEGDLIIKAQFSPKSWDIDDTLDRYLLKEVTPTTIRGFNPQVNLRGRNGEFKVAQSAQIDRLEYSNDFYDVPIVFDYDQVPDPEPDVDPSDYPEGTLFSSKSLGIVIRGQEENEITSMASLGIVLPVSGMISSASTGLVIVGENKGVHVYL